MKYCLLLLSLTFFFFQILLLFIGKNEETFGGLVFEISAVLCEFTYIYTHMYLYILGSVRMRLLLIPIFRHDLELVSSSLTAFNPRQLLFLDQIISDGRSPGPGASSRLAPVSSGRNPFFYLSVHPIAVKLDRLSTYCAA